jgi:putative hydrolase of the HAD superfamily
MPDAPPDVATAFAHVETWVFDLDDTLYPPGIRLFAQIEARMTDYVSRLLEVPIEEADRLRRRYRDAHGTTLAGLMALHDADPAPYLAHVHDIDFRALAPEPPLTAALAALPGRRIVHTNATAGYAARVLAARGLGPLFDAVYGVEETGFCPKPRAEAFARVAAADGFDPARAAMFEDDPRNLAVPHARGMRTVLVRPTPPPDRPAHVDHHTDNLAAFLTGLAPVRHG